MIIHETTNISVQGIENQISCNELLIIKTLTGRLKLIFGFDNEITNLLKSFAFYRWDTTNKWWSVPYSEKYLAEIKELAITKGMKITYEEEPKGDKGIPRVAAGEIPNYRCCPDEMLQKLREMRYSKSTIKTYTNFFEEFINYYFRLDINMISEKQIIEFLHYLVTERNVSTSYQNQAINSIKFYYEKVLGGQRKFYFINRPKEYLFEGADCDVYSPRSIQNMIRDIVAKTTIKKHVTMHTLRHTFATHLPRWIKIKQICTIMSMF